jgi:hypothetical protein
MNKQHLRHPRIQRAFVRWFKRNNRRFAVPIRVSKATSKGMEFRFINYPDCLSVWLSRDGLSVHVNWQEHWDMLLDIDVGIKTTNDGYQCLFCFHEGGMTSVLFSSKEALWQDHIFEPFLEWVNEKLAPARWLQISGTAGGSTWTRLIKDKNALEKPDPGLILMQGLVRIDGTQAFDEDTDVVSKWLVELKPEASLVDECFKKYPTI